MPSRRNRTKIITALGGWWCPREQCETRGLLLTLTPPCASCLSNTPPLPFQLAKLVPAFGPSHYCFSLHLHHQMTKAHLKQPLFTKATLSPWSTVAWPLPHHLYSIALFYWLRTCHLSGISRTRWFAPTKKQKLCSGLLNRGTTFKFIL